MAGEMIYPIKFDLDSAVKEASTNWESTYADKLEKALAKRKVKVSLALETKALDNLDDVQKRLKELKIEPFTPENRKAIQELTRELKALAKTMAKLSDLRGVKLPELQRAQAAKLAKETAQAEEKLALQKERVRQAEERLILAQQRAARQATATGHAFRSQSSYLERLIKRMTIYASIGALGAFLTKVREVTAEFELQRVSLGAIIQDQTRANALFSEIKSFALKSPVSILDLTKYTKQLAAYKIGVNELFETTKKLTDVSVGLGVSMDRVVLAYGQTRATGHLRSSEIRQFTEMGVPIVEELAAKLSKMNGELVTAAQVMDMVSKRSISFEMVKEVFDDMTSAGGIFYNMQEKQGNTLFGLWAKLGDAASVMYDEIGNTDTVNSAMKTTIGLLTELMRNWKATALTMATVGGVVGTFFAANVANKRGTNIQNAAFLKEREAKAALSIANKKLKVAEDELAAAKGGVIKKSVAEAQAERDAAAATLSKADADYKAAAAANANVQKQSKLALGFASIGKSLLSGLGIGLVITVVTTLIYKLYEAWMASGRLRDALAEIDAKGAQTAGASVQNFRSLANAALAAEDGSRKQNEALEELHRTYGNMIPVQDLTIEKLRALKGEYSSLTDAIREYIAQQTLQQKISAVSEEYGKGIEDANKKLLKYLQTVKTNFGSIGENQARRIIGNLRRGIEIEGKNIKIAIRDAFSAEGLKVDVDFYSKATNAMGNYAKQVALMSRAIKKVNEETKDSLGALCRYADEWEATTKAMANFSSTTDKDSFLYSREKLNDNIGSLTSFIKHLFSKENLKWDETAFGDFVDDVGKNGEKVSVLFWDKINDAAKNGSAQLKKALEKAQNAYYDLVPRDAVVNRVRDKFNELANSMGVIDKVRANMMGATEDLESYRKKINDTAKDYAQQVQNLTKVLATTPAISLAYQEIAKKLADAEELKKFYESMAEILGKTNTGGSQSDPRLGVLQEMASTLKSVNKEYDDLAKKQGADKAYANTFRIYQQTFDNMRRLSEKYGFGLPDFDVPTDATSLKRYLDAVRKAMKSLPKSDKAVLALQVDIEKIDIDDMQEKLDKELKDLSDRIARSKTAKEFYDKILSQTGDVDVAINMTMSVYGTNGGELQNEMADYIRSLFGSVSVDTAIEVGTGNVDYTELEVILDKNLDTIAKNNAEVIRKLIEDGKKANAAQVQQWFKDLKTAEDFADKRVKLARETAKRIADIEAQARLQGMSDNQKNALISGFREREDKEAAKLEYEAFKETPMYVQMFDDLDNASTTMLRNMQSMLQGLKGKWGEALEPTQLKEMQSRLNAISKQLAKRNPFKAIGSGIGKLRTLNKEYGSLKEQESKLATATEKLLKSKDYLTAALRAEAAAREAYNKAVRENGADSEEAQNAQKKLNFATATVKQKIKDVNLTEKLVKLLQEIVDEYKGANDEVSDGINAISQYVAKIKEAQDAIRGAVEEWSALGDDEMWNTIFDGLDYLSTSATQGGEAAQAYMSGDYFTMVTKGIASVANLIAGIGRLFYGTRVAKANKEIKRQQDLIDQLEYSYDRLENAIEGAFGSAYLRLYRQQLANLQKQQSAYLKQAEAERSKGKKADKDKIKDYENSARDAADAIADMQGTLAEKFLGSDLASTARDFAKAWLDAYKEFGNTADAMSEKFHEMIQNMVVESLLGSVMEKALKPAFDMIDNMEDTDFTNQDFWKSLTDTAAQAVQNADAGAYTMMSFLEQAGITMRDLGSDLTGISRDVASASEESINGLAAGINTQNFYISQQLAEVRLIREAVVGRGDSGAMFTDLMAMQNEHLSHLPVIAANTAATVERCERAALACEDMASQLRRVIRPKQEGAGNYMLNAKVFK